MQQPELMAGCLDNFDSRRTPVLVRHGGVVCAQPLAAECGLDILKRGGNAADAAVATAAAMAVTQPTSNGLGGDAFCLYYDGKTKKVSGLNGCGRSGSQFTLDNILSRGWSKNNHFGPTHGLAVTVPGAPAAMLDTLKHFGTGKFSREEIFSPTIKLAEKGFPVTEVCHAIWKMEEPKFHAPENIYRKDMLVGNRAPLWGEVWKNENIANVFKSIVKDGHGGYYQGWVAQAIVDTVQRCGGVLTLDDLSAHTSTLVEPIDTDYKGVRLWEIPPSTHGLVALLALNILKGYDLQGMGHNSPEYLHHLVEALRLSFTAGLQHITDLSHMTADVTQLLSEEYATTCRQRIDPHKASQGPDVIDIPEGSDTIYISVVDEHGNACSYIQSNYTGFGTGLVPKDCGFTLQNRGKDFKLDESHANVAGPNKRCYHTIIPGMVTDSNTGDLLSSYGNMGAYMQPQGHIQLLLNMKEFGMNPQCALDKRRIFLQPQPGNDHGFIYLEAGISGDVANALRSKGHKVIDNVSSFERRRFGRGQIITRGAWWRKSDVIADDKSVWWMGSCPRGDGVPMGY